jgi:hypothetical protein
MKKADPVAIDFSQSLPMAGFLLFSYWFFAPSP